MNTYRSLKNSTKVSSFLYFFHQIILYISPHILIFNLSYFLQILWSIAINVRRFFAFHKTYTRSWFYHVIFFYRMRFWYERLRIFLTTFHTWNCISSFSLNAHKIALHSFTVDPLITFRFSLERLFALRLHFRITLGFLSLTVCNAHSSNVNATDSP